MKKLLVVSILLYLFPTQIYANSVVSNLITPVSYFINHIYYLKELNNNLIKYKKTSIVATSGVGKTQLARMYAYDNQQDYTIIWFVDSNLDIDAELVKLAKAINRHGNQQIIKENISEIRESIMDYLSTKDKWLLVFDNNKTKNNNKLKEFIDWENNGHVIFCSQDSSVLPHIIPLKNIQGKDSKELAKSILMESSIENEDFLAEEFKGYPVLIVQGAQILNNIKGLSFAKYKQMIKKSDDSIKLNIELALQELPMSANNLLKKIALINNQSFSKSLLGMITSNKATLDDDIYQLSRFALISSFNTKQVNNNPIYEMHDVISETIQEINGAEQNKKYIEEIISEVIEKSFPNGVAKRYIVRTSPTVNENFQILLKNAEKFHINIYKNLQLRLELFGTSVNSGHYDTSKVMIEWFEEKEKNKRFLLSEMTNHEKFVYAYYYNAIGYYNIIALSNPVSALNYFSKAKEIISVVEGYEYMKYNINYQLFATSLSLGRIEGAEKVIRELSDIYEAGLKNNTIDKSEIIYLYGGKARLFLARGEYNEALEQINKCIETLQQHNFKENDKFLVVGYQLKIEILNALDQYKEAYSLAEWFYKTYKSSFPPDHEIFANLYTKIAVAQYGQEKYQEALDNANKALAMLTKVRKIDFEKIQFTKDIQLAKALTIKADCLSVLGIIEEALKIYEKAEAIHNNIYVGCLPSSISLKYILFNGAKTACKKPNKLNEFWYKHFYGNLRSIFGIDTLEVHEIERICPPEVYDTTTTS